MAAGDKLLITYTGRDERTNAKRPPAVPVGELLDMVDRSVRTTDGTRPRNAIVVHHPLQPFDPKNFTPGALAGPEPWSFDRITLDGARHLIAERLPPPPFLKTPLPATHSPVVELDDLVRFVQHPIRAFLRQRLGLTLGDWSTEIDDALPVVLDSLEEWGVGQRMLDACLEGCDARAICLAEMRRGHLPPGVLGKPVVDEIFPMARRLATEAEQLAGSGAATSVDVRLDLPDGRALTGTVGGVRGDAVQVTTFSKVSAKHRLAAWVRVLALAAAHPERAWTAATVGRGPDDGIAVARIRPLGESAIGHLATLVDLHDRGMREPVPLAARTSAAYARARTFGGDAERAARKEWETDRYPREDDDADHVLAFGGRLSFGNLIAIPPRDDEGGRGWDDAEPSRFGRLAMRLWAPLLAVEERRDL
jgi:exodeoxyribonuclease V gamma subunit